MTTEELKERVNKKAEEFGLKEVKGNTSNAVVRSNITAESFDKGLTMMYPLSSFLKRVDLVLLL